MCAGTMVTNQGSERREHTYCGDVADSVSRGLLLSNGMECHVCFSRVRRAGIPSDERIPTTSLSCPLDRTLREKLISAVTNTDHAISLSQSRSIKRKIK